MSIASIQNATTLPTPSTAPTSAKSGTEDSNFVHLFADAINQNGQTQLNAERQVNAMLSGNGTDVHSAMLAVEQASLSFELMLQVRNKVVNAYQEISRLQF